ncbi:hypothetical protein GCK72_007692 [Caenorhabditis remanei]|uniref:Uncharacterized protein n=1 Tax=Caenorhabditis remanei TaxID=31234 RepID=A0A6A5HMZ7_CAERE|nr:hypothetical protein GCK72_007692 [Caenorhabditis remanei]KAF1767733.1 hypothetical protein GCK72_007692 [Caenorhabditis remanei]
MIDSSILPLKELRVNLQMSPRFVEHCEISRKLIIIDHEINDDALPLILRILAEPEIKSVVLEGAPENNDGRNFVQQWVKTNREIGNSLDMCLPAERSAWWLSDGTLGFLKESNGL